jgi:glycosyltransferase involved in cell wall biosynthesis
MIPIVHLTSVHPRSDARIHAKQCRTLARAGYAVTLMVADGLGDSQAEPNLAIVDVGRPASRRERLAVTGLRLLRQVRQRGAAVVHLHDPELLPLAWLLKRQGLRVIFDAHEDVPLQLLGKPYLAPALARWLARLYPPAERLLCQGLDAIVAATPAIAEKMRTLGPPVISVANYPLLSEFPQVAAAVPRERALAYVGGLSHCRGLSHIVQANAAVRPPGTLYLAGTFWDPALQARLAAGPAWEHVRHLGVLERAEVAALLARCRAGLVTLLPQPNYIQALPVKLFEYMAAGLPVIASHFPRWRQIVEGHECGLCVDPTDIGAIARAIQLLHDQPELAEQWGRQGRAAVLRHYHWQSEADKLLELYRELAGAPQPCGLLPPARASAETLGSHPISPSSTLP